MQESWLAGHCTGRKSSPGSLRDAPPAPCSGPPPVDSEGEAGSAEQRKESSDNGREDAHSAIKLRDGVDQLLPVPVERCDGDDRPLTTSPPRGNSRARDPDVLGQASGAGPDHLLPNTVVVRAACPGRGHRRVWHRQSITRRGSPGQPTPQ
jgi:hypothetical protein